jgi:hypothetical protein
VVAVRTLVVTVAPLLAELVIGVLDPYVEIDVVGILDSRDELTAHLRRLAPDLVLLGLTGAETDASARPLLAALPTAEILVLAPTGRHAWLYEMRPHRTVLADLSVATLVKTVALRFRGQSTRRLTSPGRTRREI